MWIDSEGTLKPEQHEFGPYLRAPPFVAARRNAIMVPRFYAEKKKMSSGTLKESNSSRNSISGRERTPEQPQEVTVSTNDSIEVEEIMSLKRNEGEGIIREDTSVQNRVNEGIIGELNTSKETEIKVELNTPRNNSSLITRDNLSGTSSLKSHDTNGNRVHKQKSPHASCTWTRRETIKPKDNTTARVQTQGKKRMVALEVYHMVGSTK